MSTIEKGSRPTAQSPAKRPIGAVLVTSLVLECVAIAFLLISGIGHSGGTGIGSVLTPPVVLIALAPASLLQLLLALQARREEATPAGALATGGPAAQSLALHIRGVVLGRFRGVFIALAGGLWILVAIVVGLATSGGVVWF
jgi:hypothetical protein